MIRDKDFLRFIIFGICFIAIGVGFYLGLVAIVNYLTVTILYNP